MRVQIHRGAREIGGSCIEVETAGERIHLDAGLPLNLPAGSSPIPLKIDLGSLCTIIISHPHLDHYGLLPWMPSVPVVMGATSRRILRTAAPFTGQPAIDLERSDLVDGKPMEMGPFRITPYLIDHSAYDSYALLLEADGKRLFYSGDFRTHGCKQGVAERLISSPPTNIDILLLEGTTLGWTVENNPPKTEDELEDAFYHIFKATDGLALVHASGQNIDRIVSIYRACIKTGRILVIDLYVALILEATENPKIPQSHWDRVALCIPQRQRVQIKTNRWFDELARHSSHRIYPEELAKKPGRYALLFRPGWMKDLDRVACLPA